MRGKTHAEEGMQGGCSSVERQISGSTCSTTGIATAHAGRDSIAASYIGDETGKDLTFQSWSIDKHITLRQPAKLFALDRKWFKMHTATINDVKHLVAGGLSAIFSKTATAPFERVKMEMQLKQKTQTIAVARELLTDSGPLTFWKGNGMNLIRVTPHKAVNFYCYSLYKTVIRKAMGGQAPGAIDKFIAGALAGTTATLLCFPLDVIRTRMLSQEGDIYRTAFGTVKKMLKEESLASFYVGCLPAVCSTAASGAIFYGVYDLLKEDDLRRKRKRTGKDEVNLSAAKMLLFGALAGAAAESILYPLEVLRRRMQLQSMSSRRVVLEARQYESRILAAATDGGAETVPAVQRLLCSVLHRPKFKQAVHAAIDIYKMDRLPGFYQGFLPHILQVLPSAALSYYFYEASKRALNVADHQ